jgi:CBS domain-containing protein
MVTSKTKAKDIMTKELVVGRESITLEEAIKILVNNRITGFPIVDDKKRLIGILSELDIIEAVSTYDGNGGLDLDRKMKFRKKVRTISEDATFQEIITAFLEQRVRRLPVVDAKGRLTGIVSRRDVMRTLFYKAKASHS